MSTSRSGSGWAAKNRIFTTHAGSIGSSAFHDAGYTFYSEQVHAAPGNQLVGLQSIKIGPAVEHAFKEPRLYPTRGEFPSYAT